MTDQKLAALDLANHVRRTVARTKERIAALDAPEGHELAARLLRDESLGACRVGHLLRAPRSAGPAHTQRICVRAHVTSAQRLRELTDRQLDALEDELKSRANKLRKGRKERSNGS